jgi:hypothetical protein
MPIWLQGEDVERTVRLLRAAARAVNESRWPILALWNLWVEILRYGASMSRLRALGARIKRLSEVGLGADAGVLLEQVCSMTWDGRQGVLRLDGLTPPQTPKGPGR